MKRNIVILLFGLLFAYVEMYAQDQTKSINSERQVIYECRQISADIQLSGKADDPVWKLAHETKLVDPISGEPGKFATTVKLLYNSRYLYIAFECEDDFIWGTITGRDSAIFTEECVEAFICPSGKTRQYYELNVSPRNAIFDAFIFNGRSESGEKGIGLRTWKDFTCEGMETRVFMEGELDKSGAKKWSVEYAIPFSSIIGSDNLSPVLGEEWKMNLFRIDSPVKGKLEFYSWSPTWANDFHRFWKFGILKFVGN